MRKPKEREKNVSEGDFTLCCCNWRDQLKREVMGSILFGGSDLYLSHARVMLINSLFTFHYRA